MSHMIFVFLQKVSGKSQKGQKKWQKMPKSAEKSKKAGFHSMGATIGTRQESLCLPYAGFILIGVQTSTIAVHNFSFLNSDERLS